MIGHIDNFLTPEEHSQVMKYVFGASYCYGETDNDNTPPTGMISNIEDIEISDLFDKKIKNLVKEVSNFSVYRMYINCFAPGENPYFHRDGETGITCLYYVNPEYRIDDGGETQFFLSKDESINILPIPNRLCYFDANIIHRATSFREIHRFTIAIKYK